MNGRFNWLIWIWRAALAIYWLAALLGYGSRASIMGWIVGPETWLTNRVPDPIMFAFVTGLIISTWLVPSVWSVVKHRFVSEPVKANPLSLPTMSVSSIAEYLLNESRWGWENYLRLSLRKFVRDHVSDEMRRAGRAYQVRYIGSPPNSDATVEIGRAYWQYATIDQDRVWDARNRFFTTILPSGAPIYGGSFNYQHGSAPNIDVFQTWPRASAFYRSWVTARIWLRKARYRFPRYLDERVSPRTFGRDDDQDDDIPADPEWMSPYKAIDEFCGADPVKARDDANELLTKAVEAHANAVTKMNTASKLQPRNTGGATVGDTEELVLARRDVFAKAKDEQLATGAYKEAWKALHQDIEKQLADGVLTAKGIPAPFAIGKEEVEIPSHEWRLLKIEPAGQQALDDKLNPAYVALVIKKREQQS